MSYGGADPDCCGFPMATRVGRRYAALGAPLAALLVAACASDRVLEPCLDAAHGMVAAALPASPFDAWFEEAGRRYGVDPALLRAVAWTETRLHMVGHEPAAQAHDHDHHGLPPAWGVMALRGERLERAAQLAGLAADDVRRSPAANVLAAAALLAEDAAATGVSGRAADAWRPALERFSGIAQPAGRAAYADAVLRAAAQGSRPAGAAGGTGATGVAAAAAAPDCLPPAPPVTPPVTPPPGAVVTRWHASPNFNARMAGDGGRIGMIIIHTCEGSYVGCWSWLSSAASGVSAHYVIDEDGTEITQLVEEPMRAWHIGARYDCALNRGRACALNDVQSNHFTVGVEHAGYASQPAFPSNQIDVSAQLVCAITERYGIPRDGQHIVAHGQLQPWNRTDPGPNWPWIGYLARVQRFCGEVVVDDAPAFNDAAFARVLAPDAWNAGSATAGYYGGGYHWATTHPDRDDAFAFEFLLEAAGTYTVEARWTAGENRTAAAVFTVTTAAGQPLATAAHDQRAHHDEWRAIATLALAPGWHRVELSRRGVAGSVVVADAIRVR